MINERFIIANIIVVVLAYVLGSINFAIIVSRSFKSDDVRNHGSGNAGMTNMLRTYGKKMAFLTAAGDFLKAVLAVILARAVYNIAFIDIIDPGYIAGLFVLLGHSFPIFFKFKGGKGVMTSLGIIAAVNIQVGIILMFICLPLIYVTRIVSLASITGAISYPVLVFFISYNKGKINWFEVICAFITGTAILMLHRENVARLQQGTENRFGSK